jgi:hypothetical protein
LSLSSTSRFRVASGQYSVGNPLIAGRYQKVCHAIVIFCERLSKRDGDICHPGVYTPARHVFWG